MNTLPTTSLSKPIGADQLPAGTLAYMRTRLRRRIHSLILKEFAGSGLSQADLARRLGKKKSDQVCRWLAAPVNFRLSTLSDLLFAINGGEIVDQMQYPLDQAARNDSLPEWLINDKDMDVTPQTPQETTIKTGSTNTAMHRVLEHA